jgi:hypothetical protein
MDHTFPVTVVDDAAATVAGARVCVAKKAALGAEHHPFPSLAKTHDDKGGGKYQEAAAIAPTEEDWVLLVTLGGKAPVFQPFNLKARGDEFTASPRPSAVATVTITNTVRKVGGTRVKEIAFHVTLFPAAEIAFIAGVDYHNADISKGWLFHEYAFNRAEALRREKKIHAGAIVTVFSTAKIWRTTRVWGVKKWVDVEVAQLGDPSTRIAAAAGKYIPVAGLDIHIRDFYKYLATVGAREPHSVKEIGICSHSYPGGPILYDTMQADDFKPGGAHSDQRDPDDFDARPKDFNAVNFPGWSGMTSALDPNCRFTIWGCSATTHFKWRSRRALQAINKGLAEDAFFLVESDILAREPPHELLTVEQERTSEIRHRWMMDVRFRKGAYAAEAAKKLGIEVRAGCPGTGSDPKTEDGIEMLMVDFGTYGDVFQYFHKKFAPEFAETHRKWDKGYVDYHALQSRPPVPKPAFSMEYYDFTVDKKAAPPDTPATLRFWNGKTVDHPSPDVTLAAKPVADLVTVGKKGILYTLNDKDKANSQAVYVQEDAQVFKVTQDAAHDWTVIGAPL